MVDRLEAQIGMLDQSLGEAERHLKVLLGRVSGMRKRANAGEITQVSSMFEALPGQVEQLGSLVQAAQESVTYDTASALADGSYVDELRAEAAAQDVVLTERDGRLTAFPLLLKLEPKLSGVRVGRKLEKRLRPSVLVQLLRKAQAASRFDAGRFLARLFSGYTYLAPAVQAGWQPNQAGTGPVVTLAEIYTLLTLLPAAAADYSREEFAIDLLRLDAAPDATTAAGHSFSLPASTGSKGRNRLTVFDESGAERVFVGIRFSLNGAGGGDGSGA